MKTFLLIDAVNILFRSYFAIAPMANAQGESTQGLFGFIRSLQKLQTLLSPDYLVAVFDGPDNKKARQELFRDYKAHRTPTPEDLPAQVDKAMHFCKLAGVPMLCLSGVEADDVIG
ncbi:MAG: DNA polymerase I, partial [Chlamydiae bacterium]|nr:DNA polymerase I [Chlamydiota bacterium]